MRTERKEVRQQSHAHRSLWIAPQFMRQFLRCLKGLERLAPGLTQYREQFLDLRSGFFRSFLLVAHLSCLGFVAVNPCDHPDGCHLGDPPLSGSVSMLFRMAYQQR